jgi:hypothetical protein
MESEIKDPRSMTRADLESMGIAQMPLLKAIREKCIDCSGGSQTEVTLCPVTRCTLWPFRMNKNPWRAAVEQKPPSEAQIAARERFAERRRLEVSSKVS